MEEYITTQAPVREISVEQQRRLHRCCIMGRTNRPEKDVRLELASMIRQAVAEGFTTFIVGMSCGLEMWAGEEVVRLRKDNPDLHLIAAVPFPGYEGRWSANMQMEFHELVKMADVVRYISPAYSSDTYQRRDEWMIDHSARIITGTDLGRSIDYARMLEVPVITLKYAAVAA